MQVRRRGMIDDAGTIAPIEESPDAVRAIVRGGGGKHSSGQPAFRRQARPVTRLIGRRDGAWST